jgi:hypothetical protein
MFWYLMKWRACSCSSSDCSLKNLENPESATSSRSK